jgi:putative aminophosphonate oxidoreductase
MVMRETWHVRSLWLDEALAGETADAVMLEGDERADVCIVGGGYAGLWTALRLKELDPALDVVVVESDICGAGASGRNGGFVLSWWAKFGSLKKICGKEEALRLARLAAEAVVELGAFCDEHGIDAHYRLDGWLWAATSAAQTGSWDATVAELEKAGVRVFVRLGPAEVSELAGASTHVAGVLEPAAATVQPALLVRGLRRVALERGVTIYERSAMTALERGRQPSVRTAHGRVAAERVVLTMNAWAVRLRELRRAVLVVASDVVATEPVPEPPWPRGLCISDSRLLVNYYRSTLDGRVVFGQGGGALAFAGRVGRVFEGPSPRADELAASMLSLYPSLSGVPIEKSWSGPIDRTRTGLPFFGRLGGRPEILYAVGFSGNGVGPSFVGGRILASLALGLDDEWSRAGLVRDPVGAFPPEPVRYLGGRLVRAAVARKERAEDEGRPPARLDSWLTGLAPAGLVPTRRGAVSGED